ncbi:hypothetical protein DFJ74DRAFT_662744 [Hyaloraphidium curvatum]|nr:hypothetical protein DFJ74DRAFT_662744 [Hyaloraphidium curvatum]
MTSILSVAAALTLALLFTFGALAIVQGALILVNSSALIPGAMWSAFGGGAVLAAAVVFVNRRWSSRGMSRAATAAAVVGLLCAIVAASYSTSTYVNCGRDRQECAETWWNSLTTSARERYQSSFVCSGFDSCSSSLRTLVSSVTLASMIVAWISVCLLGFLLALSILEARSAAGSDLELGSHFRFVAANHLVGTTGHDAPDGSWLGFYESLGGSLPDLCPCLDHSLDPSGRHHLAHDVHGAHVFAELEGGRGFIYGITPTCAKCNYPGPRRRALKIDKTRPFTCATIYVERQAASDPHARFKELRDRDPEPQNPRLVRLIPVHGIGDGG